MTRPPTTHPKHNANATARVAWLVAGKDLRVEWRSRVMLNQILPFAAIVMVMFAFALASDNILERVAPGLVWLASLFSLLVMVQRTFAVESADGALDALRAAGVRPAGIFLGKSLALGGQLVALVAVLTAAAMILYRSNFNDASAVGAAVLLVTTTLAAACGLAFVGTLYGGLATGAKGRETLLPLLLLPVVAPVLIGATRATEAAFGVGKTPLREGWPWVAFLAVYAVAFGVGGALAFGSLIDE